MSFDKIFDLIAGVYFYFYNIYNSDNPGTNMDVVGVPRTRGCLGYHALDHVEMGAMDGPSEAVVKDRYNYKFYRCLRRRKKGT